MYLTLGRFSTGRDSALVVFDSSGSVLRVDAGVHPILRRPNATSGDSLRSARWRLMRDGRLTLIETRLWELVPSMPARPLQAGARWTETLAREAGQEGYAQSMRGVRVSTILRDTIVDGRRSWLVRDSAAVRYEERWEEEERTLDTLVVVHRNVTGTVVGQHLYDPGTGLIVARADTTMLSGTAVLRYPDGRSFQTPARYEGFKRWTRYDPDGYAVRVAASRAERDRQQGGMVRPLSEIERRLRNGDSVLRDSVFREWQRATNPDEIERLFRLLGPWALHDSRLDSLRIAAGDTAYLYRKFAAMAYSARREPVSTPDMRHMIAFMEDPGRAFSLGESRDWLYENLRQGLTTWPPAVTADSAVWSCTPEACRLLAEQWRVGREARLRALGLVALVTLDPERWADTVLARRQRDSSFLVPAAMLVRGVGSTWPSGSKVPIPPPNAGWNHWLEWMNGRDPRYPRPSGTPASGAPRVRFEDVHVTAIRFYQARTGRDVIGELQRGYAASASDSARLVFGSMLYGLGALRLSAAELATAFRSGSAARRILAQRVLFALVRDSGMLADTATSIALLDRLIATTVEGAEPWRMLGAPAGAVDRRPGPTLHQRPAPRTLFLRSDSLPPALQERWRSRVQIVDSKTWNERPQHEAGVLYTMSSVTRLGPFAMLSVMASERLARAPGAAPRMYASRTRYFLMEVDGEWVIVAKDAWVT